MIGMPAGVPDLEVTVRHIQAAPQGSKSHVGRGRMIESSRRVAPWRDAVVLAARSAAAGRGLTAPLDGPLAAEIVLTVARPASAPGRVWPTTRASGDLDKLLRSTWDALGTARVIEDDSRIVQVSAIKAYPGGCAGALDGPGGVIRLWRIVPDGVIA